MNSRRRQSQGVRVWHNMQTFSISRNFTLQVVHGSFCEKTMALLVGSSDALAALASSQKLPCTICNENSQDMLKMAHLKRHSQNPVHAFEATSRIQLVLPLS